MDLLMDFAITAAVQFSLSRLHMLRLALALALLRAGTMLANILGSGFAPWLHLPLLMLCAPLIIGDGRPARMLQAAACMLCYSAAAAGFFLLGGKWLAVSGVGLLAALVRRSRNLRFRWNIEVELEKNGIRVRFPALIDTGNRLREHRSGLPVLIAAADAVPALAGLTDALEDDEKRSLPYGVLGGSGCVSCFRCDKMRMLVPGSDWIDAPPCWTAVFPGRIPGSACALAPPEFADAAQDDWKGIREFGRRSFYGVFKREAIHLRFGGADSQGFGLLHRRQ